MLPRVEADSFASTYATAWSLLALNACKTDPLLPQSLRDSMSTACASAVSWMVPLHEHSKAIWKDYPHHLQGEASVSNSALIVHALMEAGGEERVIIAKLWGGTARPDTIDVGKKEAPVDIWVRTGGEYIPDASIYFAVLPWVLIANEDSYQYCGLMGRIMLTKSTRRLLRESWQRSGTAPGDEWMASEALIALNYVKQRHSGASHPATRSWALASIGG
jgi:hypothetical protein